jgi:hypothetical protein
VVKNLGTIKSMDLSDLINRSEKKILKTLELFFEAKWDETKLWSHDLDHHRRVWNYAKELLRYTDKESLIIDPVFIEKLQIKLYPLSRTCKEAQGKIPGPG